MAESLRTIIIAYLRRGEEICLYLQDQILTTTVRMFLKGKLRKFNCFQIFLACHVPMENRRRNLLAGWW